MNNSEFSPWRVRLGAIALLLSVFTAGAFAGAVFYRWVKFDERNEGAPPIPPFALFSELDLTAEQRTRAQAVFERYRPTLDSLLRETFPKVRAVHEQIDADIAKFLTDAQRKKLEELRMRRGPFPRGPFRGDPPPSPGAFGSPGPDPLLPHDAPPPPPDHGFGAGFPVPYPEDAGLKNPAAAASERANSGQSAP